jgi:hypothetical protein
VRLALKVLIAIPSIQELAIETVAHNGRPLRKYRITRLKAQPYFEKLDDPFERRRARDWWNEFAERVK